MLAALSTLSLVIAALLTPAVAQAALSPVDEFADERALILQQTNTLRSQNGLPPLRLNAALNDLAQDWSQQQARASTMSHRPNFTAMYPSGWTRASENVAAGYAANRVVGAWADSAGHRTNLLSNATDIGIGIAANSSGRLYYTQNFGRYSSSPPSPPGEVFRVAGPDRFSTSARISSQAFPGGASTVYVASGLNYPDAVSAAALAGAADGPLLLVQPGAIPSPIRSELRRLDPDRIVVVGGTSVIWSTVQSALRSYASRVDRIAGSDRLDTSRRLAQDAYPGGANTVYLATAWGFADALAAGPAAASVDAPVVLVDGRRGTADADTVALLNRLGATRVVIIGGTRVVSSGIESALRSSGRTVERIAGADRYSTAALIGERHFPDAAVSYVATGQSFADALSGGAAAGAIGAPLFTSEPGCVPRSAHSALRAQDPDTVLLLGGLGALRPGVAGFYRC